MEDASDHPKNEKLPLSDCLVCFDHKISCLSLYVDTLFLEVLPAIPENTKKSSSLFHGFCHAGWRVYRMSREKLIIET